ncbi:hypothetical protein [Pontibacter saemangeumensis]|uniref:hypothetical protein n=1 Tax=Pontibacter saemangeumensis TaxID=1084525 RepID=UPI0031E9306E
MYPFRLLKVIWRAGLLLLNLIAGSKYRKQEKSFYLCTNLLLLPWLPPKIKK